MKLEKYSIGVGDRFGCQGKAQLGAVMAAAEQGVEVVPVWNKSHREHTIIGTEPASVRREADEAVQALGWRRGYYVDADHIGLGNVDLFLEASDFFTLDVAESIGTCAGTAEVDAFVEAHRAYIGMVAVPGLTEPLGVTEDRLRAIADTFLGAVMEAGRIYRHVADAKGAESFVTEVSMDEAEQPQTPAEMLFILAAIAREGIPAQTIAPKFTGRFNKGVDYVGDVGQFTREFEEDLAVIAFAVEEFGLPENLKLSVHSGSDKFSIYGPIRSALERSGAGLHLKTAGTTWLEELIGLAVAGGDGLAIAHEVYEQALARFDELCAPYATVIDIDRGGLPSAETVAGWTGEEYAGALRHDPSCAAFNPHIRQLLHVGYKVAAEQGKRYREALARHKDVIARNVRENLFERHLARVFPGLAAPGA